MCEQELCAVSPSISTLLQDGLDLMGERTQQVISHEVSFDIAASIDIKALTNYDRSLRWYHWCSQTAQALC